MRELIKGRVSPYYLVAGAAKGRTLGQLLCELPERHQGYRRQHRRVQTARTQSHHHTTLL